MISTARSYWKRTRSDVEAQKSQVLQMPALRLRFRIFRRSAMIAMNLGITQAKVTKFILFLTSVRNKMDLASLACEDAASHTACTLP